MSKSGDGFFVLSKPVSKAKAESMWDTFTKGLPKGETASLMTVKEAKTKKNVVGSEYLDMEVDETVLAKGGHIGFQALERKIAKNLKGKKVGDKYQNKYGKTYSADEAKEAAANIAGAVKKKVEAKKRRGTTKSKELANKYK